MDDVTDPARMRDRTDPHSASAIPTFPAIENGETAERSNAAMWQPSCDVI